MGSRERKREELRRRKQRSAERAPVGASPETGAPEPTMSRSEQRDQEAREALVPLGEGERPLVVTIGAIISALLALAVVVAYALGTEVNGEKANVTQVVIPFVVMGVMAWGMWRARYWAALGFQTVLLIVILVSALSLVLASSVVKALANVVVLAIAGPLFYFMIKAMARIQMPSANRPTP